MEAQSLLNQIAQSRNLKEQDNNPSNNDIETITNVNNVTSNIATSILDTETHIDISLDSFKPKLLNKPSTSAQISTGAETNADSSTAKVMDSDSEAEGEAYNDFQIKRFQLRKDI